MAILPPAPAKAPAKTPDELFAFLDRLGIAHETFWHPPVFTANDMVDYGTVDAGLRCKNLFVENKDGQRWLVTMPSDARAEMNHINKQLGSGRLSFVKGEHMLEALGVPPGHATPFAFLNDSAQGGVRAAIDASVAAAPRISIHPLTNTASTMVSGADLLAFFKALGMTPAIISTSSVAATA